MMKQTTILICVLLSGLVTTLTVPVFGYSILEDQPATCPCACDKEKDLQVLTDIYNSNGGANWMLPTTGIYQDILTNEFKNVPNAGNIWDINAPNAQDSMGTWHGVMTNPSGCITGLVLWNGSYEVDGPLDFAPQGIGLTGELPESIGQLCALERLMIPHNNLTGGIPTSIGGLCSLEVLLVHNNELNKPIPSEIGMLDKLLHLGLHFNELSGFLPASITSLTNLVILHLNNNKLTDAIPVDIGNLDQLRQTDLSNNCFSGIVPASIVNLGRNSPSGQTEQLFLQNNKLDSLPNISALQIDSEDGIVDISGNHLTFDDILPNTSILTKYSDQTLDLNQLFCAMEGDILVIRPGFDAMIDQGFYGTFNTYYWSRPGTTYRDSSTRNDITFSGVTTFSAGNFALEVINPLAPDLRLLVSNLVVDVPTEPALFGTLEVCSESEESYSIFSALGYDFTVSGGTITTSDTTSLTVNWGKDTAGQICATNRGNCPQTTCFYINILPQVTVFITPPDTLNCSQKVSTLRGVTEENDLQFSWYSATDSIALSQTDTIDITQPGNYVLQGVNNNGCEARDTALVIEQIDKFEVAIEGENAFCENDRTTLSVGSNFLTYKWSTGETTPTIQVTEDGNYQVTVTNENNCTSSTFFEVQALPIPDATINKSGDLDCNNERIQLFRAFNQSGTTTNSSEWRDADGQLLGEEIILEVDMPGIYFLTITNELGCSSTKQIEVLKDESVVIPQIAGTTSLCEGATGQLHIDETYASYSWSTGDTTTSIPVDDSRLVYSVTVTTETGCSGSSSVTIEKRSKPTVIIGGQKEICEGGEARLFVGDQFSNYIWSDGATSFETMATAIGTYTVTVTDEDNCINTASIEVVEAMPFEAIIEGEKSFCEGASTSLFASQLPNAHYKWSTGDTSALILVETAGDYKLTITDANNCSSAVNTTVTITPLPVITITGDTTLCAEAGSSSLQVEEIYPTYNWSGGVPGQSVQIEEPGLYKVTVTDTFNCQNIASIKVIEKIVLEPEIIGNFSLCQSGEVSLSSNEDYASYIWSTGATSKSITVNAAGKYTLLVIDKNGCSGETEISVVSTTNPTPQIIGNPMICKGTATNLTTRRDYANYIWSTGDTTETISVNTTGNYQVTVTNSFGCAGVTNFKVEEAPDLAVDIIGNTAICAGSSTTIQAGGMYLAYNWNTGADSAAIEVQETGMYTLTVTNQSGCTGMAMIEVTEESSIFPQIIGTTTLCGGQPTEIQTDSEYALYNWSTGATSKSITVDSMGTYQVTVSNATGCTGMTTIDIDNTPAVTPTIEGALSFCEGQTALLQLDTVYSHYLWTGDIIRPALEVEEAGTYGVTVIDANGCTGEVSVDITKGALPPPTIDTETPFLCDGNFSLLAAEEGFTSYTWNLEDGTDLGAIILIDTAQLYTVTVTDENGCTGVNSIEIVALPTPTVNTEDPKNFCEGDTTGVPLIVPTFENYQWSTGDSTAEITAFEGRDYTVTVTNEFGCTGTGTFEVTEHKKPRSIIQNTLGKDIIDCTSKNDLIVLVSIDIGSQVGFAHRWEDENGILLATAPVLPINKGGTYRLTSTDNTTGCSAIQEKTIVELENTVALMTLDTFKSFFCSDRTATIDFSESDSAHIYKWELLVEGGFKKELEATSSIYTAEEVGKYLVIGIDTTSGCADSAWVEVIDTSYVVFPIISGQKKLCETDIGQLAVTGLYDNYAWTKGGTTQQIDITQGGYYEVTVTDENGCTGVSGINVDHIESVELDVTLEGDIMQVCEGAAVELDFIVKKNGVGPYNLTLSDGEEELFFEGIDNNEGLQLFPSSSNSYSIMHVVDMGNECSFFNGITPMVEFEIQSLPIANSTLENSCSEQGRLGAIFDLTAMEQEVKGESDAFVKWYQDSTTMTTIPATASFATSGATTTIYARINDGNCDSKPVPIVFTVADCTTNLEIDLEIGEELDLTDLPGEKREVYITNRWGDLVYASKDYEAAEKFNGSNLPQGAYYIYIKNQERTDDTHVPYKGVLYLLK